MHTRTSWLGLGLLCGLLLLPGLTRVAVGQQRVVPRPAPLNTWQPNTLQPVTWQPSTLFAQLESGDSRIEPAAQLLRLAVLDPAGAAWVLSPGRGHEVSGGRGAMSATGCGHRRQLVGCPGRFGLAPHRNLPGGPDLRFEHIP